MKIIFDHQTFSQQTYGGISRYYAELIAGINCTSNASAHLPIIFSNNIYLKDKGIPARPFFAKAETAKKIKFINYINKLYSINSLKREAFDVFHATYYDPYFLPYLKGRPFVVTFLDMIHEKFGQRFKALAYDGEITRQKRLLANRADRIIAISESTKHDIVELLDINPSKINVIYLGTSVTAKSISINSPFSHPPYLLFVGNRDTYKNFKGLLEATHPLLKRYQIKLLCAGGGRFTKDETLFIHSLKVDAFVEQCAINDQTLPLLYQKAIAFVFPSLYEGFGIPILEAFACECPCIVSNGSSLSEVAGEAALYIDPTSYDSITFAIEQIIGNSNLRQTLIQKGKERLNIFSWQRTVNKTLNLYQSII
ncbi:glycosyltransferase family 1 protein [Spirosoma migulaei]